LPGEPPTPPPAKLTKAATVAADHYRGKPARTRAYGVVRKKLLAFTELPLHRTKTCQQR